MKKMLLVAMLVLLPLSAYALEPMADGNLDEITAQEGVRITISGNGSSSSDLGMTGALEIQQKAVSTAWTNKEGLTESGIVNVVTQTEADKIYISGDLTIVAATNSSGDSFVNIGLPEVGIEKGSKKTEIYITSRTDGDDNPNKPGTPIDISDSNFISDVTGAGASGKLGTQYTDAGYTHVMAGGNITISAIAAP